MMNRYIRMIVDRFGLWRTIQTVFAAGVVILLAAAVLQFFFPVDLGQGDSRIDTISETVTLANTQGSADTHKVVKSKGIAYRSGLFKPATGLRDKPLADKTIERIKQQLTLQCVMEMNGQSVAYINVQGVGFKQCYVGQNVNDLFTVLAIDKLNKSVKISIVDHKVTLHL